MSDLPAGRELDVLVAEKLGWRWYRFDMYADGIARRMLVSPEKALMCGCKADMTEEPILTKEALPCFSTDIAAAWQVVERMGFAVAPTISLDCAIGKPDWWAGYPYFDDSIGREWTFDWQRFLGCFAETAPHAICLAALKAKVKE